MTEPIRSDDTTMIGHAIWCPKCKQYLPVEHVNPANMRHPDPTETYRLKCGHIVI
jgi:thiol-disulfide isomerase/thioredoxin